MSPWCNVFANTLQTRWKLQLPSPRGPLKAQIAGPTPQSSGWSGRVWRICTSNKLPGDTDPERLRIQGHANQAPMPSAAPCAWKFLPSDFHMAPGLTLVFLFLLLRTLFIPFLCFLQLHNPYQNLTLWFINFLSSQ